MKISVITSAYNAEKTLERTIQSVLNQTFIDFEYIIIDHGSTDSTSEIINKYSLIDKRIKKLSIDINSGFIGVAVNIGLKHSNAEYFCVIDADDAYIETFLETMYKNITEYSSDVAVCGYTFVDGNFNTINRKKINKSYYLKTKDDYSEYFNNEIHQFSGLMYIDIWWNKLYKREFFKQNNLAFDEKSNHVGDSFLNTTLFYHQPIVSFVPFVGVLYSIFNSLSTSEAYPKKRYLEYIKYAHQWLNLLNKYNFTKSNFIKMKKQVFLPIHYHKLLGSKENIQDTINELYNWHKEDILKEFVIKCDMYKKQVSEVELVLILLKNKYDTNIIDDTNFSHYYNLINTNLSASDFNWCLEYLFDKDNWSSISTQSIIDSIIS